MDDITPRSSFRFDWRSLFQKQHWRLAWSALSAVALVALFGYALQRLSLAEIEAALSRADPAWLAATLALLCAGQAARAFRWRRLLSWETPPAARDMAQALMGGQVINWLLPIRLGDLWRIWRICRSGRHAVLWGGGSIVVEKSADLLVLAIFAAALAFAPLPDSLPVSAVRLVAMACAGFLVVSPLVFLRPSFWQMKVLGRWPALQRGYDRLRARVLLLPAGLEQARRPARWLEVMAASLAVWGLAVVTNLALGRAFGVQVQLAVYVVFLLGLQFGAIVSALPANIGLFPLVALGVFAAAGVDQGRAVALGSVLYVFSYGVNLVLFGLTLLPWDRLVWLLAGRPRQDKRGSAQG